MPVARTFDGGGGIDSRTFESGGGPLTFSQMRMCICVWGLPCMRGGGGGGGGGAQPLGPPPFLAKGLEWAWHYITVP